MEPEYKQEEALLFRSEINYLKQELEKLIIQSQENEMKREQQTMNILNALKYVSENNQTIETFVQELTNRFEVKNNRTNPTNASERKEEPKISLPEKFSGTKEARNVKAWAASVRNYLEYYEMLFSPKGVTVTKSLLKEEAFTWISHRENKQNIFYQSAEALLTDLVEWIQPDYAVQQYRNQLRGLVQTGSVTAYVTKFRSLNLLIDDLHPTEALDRFVEGLKPEIALEIKKIGSELSLDQAFDIATKV